MNGAREQLLAAHHSHLQVQRIERPERGLPETIDGFQAGVVGNVLESGAPVLFDPRQQVPWRQVLAGQAGRQENG